MIERDPRVIAITGGAGLIGIELSRQLLELGHKVRVFDLGEVISAREKEFAKGAKLFRGSIMEESSLGTALDGAEIVIHLAALLGVNRSEAQKLRCFEVNVVGTKNVLDAAVKSNIKRVVFASSSEVYGEPLSNPISEDSITQGKTVYAVTKLMGEELCKAYLQQHGLEYSILRYFNCYGPCQTDQFVLPRFIKNVSSGKPPVVYGLGDQKRSYTYVSDTADATRRAAFAEVAAGEIFNIGTSENRTTLVELAHAVIDAAGKGESLKPEILGTFQGTDRSLSREIFERYCDGSKAEALLGWKPRISLQEGIAQMIRSNKIFDKWINYYDEEM